MQKKCAIIIDKNDFKFTKIDTELFNLTFEITNNNIVLPKIINFDLINLIFKLNPNIFVSIKQELEEVKELKELKEVTIYVLLKDIFCEIGLPQYYTDLHIKKTNTLSGIRFLISNNINNNKNNNKDTECLPIEQIVIDFDVITSHYVKVNCDITLTDDHNLPQFTEKIIGNMIYNIFNKVKQFIENIVFNV
jgi:hypothetical protein